MIKFFTDFLFGLAFGCGFELAIKLLQLIAAFLGSGHTGHTG